MKSFLASLEEVSTEELDNLLCRVKAEQARRSSRTNTIDSKKQKILKRQYDLYRTAVIRQLGPRARTLKLDGWTLDEFADYISKRLAEDSQVTILEIFQEEAEHRTKEYVAALKESREPNYTSLTHLCISNSNDVPWRH